MLPPPLSTARIHALRTKWTSNRSFGLWRNALMVFKLIREQHRLALGVVLVPGHVGTLLKQVLFNLLYFNNLLALPAAC